MMKESIFRKAIRYLCYKHFFDFLSDRTYLKLCYYANMGKKLNLDCPQTFNEKLQWLKLYDRNPFYTQLVDKYEVKKIVAGIIGENYIIPTLGVWDHFDDIDFDQLPDRFVLKCTHDSGGIVICKDKSTLDRKKARKKIERSLKKNYYKQNREWPYKNVKPRIIAEQYMEDSVSKALNDYKIFCFNGQAKAVFIATERQNESEETKFDFFDIDFNHLNLCNGHPNADVTPEKPERFAEMVLLAEKLSKDIPQVRIDFYSINGCVYFGEITFFHWSGFVPFQPPEWDRIFGDMITLPDREALK